MKDMKNCSKVRNENWAKAQTWKLVQKLRHEKSSSAQVRKIFTIPDMNNWMRSSNSKNWVKATTLYNGQKLRQDQLFWTNLTNLKNQSKALTWKIVQKLRHENIFKSSLIKKSSKVQNKKIFQSSDMKKYSEAQTYKTDQKFKCENCLKVQTWSIALTWNTVQKLKHEKMKNCLKEDIENCSKAQTKKCSKVQTMKINQKLTDIKKVQKFRLEILIRSSDMENWLYKLRYKKLFKKIQKVWHEKPF